MMSLKDMTEVKGVGRRRRRTPILDDLRNKTKKKYWELKRKLKIETDGNDSFSP